MIEHTDREDAIESYYNDRDECVVLLVNGKYAACNYDEVPADARIIKSMDDDDITRTFEYQDAIARMR